jgi:hypothetical protein
MTVVDSRDHVQDGNEELPTPVPWRSELLAPRTSPHSPSTFTSACRPRITRARGGEEPHTPVSYEREATPTPYSEAEREREREGEQVGRDDHHVACYHHVRHDAPSAFPESSSVSVSEYCIRPRSLARHDRSRSLPPSLSPSLFLSRVSPKIKILSRLVYCLYCLSLIPHPRIRSFSFSEYIASLILDSLDWPVGRRKENKNGIYGVRRSAE